jgi:hypothetical protein
MNSAHNREQGAALVVTLIVCTVLAMVVVALMQNTTLDRASAASVGNQYRAQLAAEAGLADAMAQMSRAITDFSYVSGTEDVDGFSRSYVRGRSVAQGVWVFSDADVAYLDSGADEPLATVLVSGPDTNTGVFKQAQYKTLTTTNSQTNRFAFWVDEANSKQNISWWGGQTLRGPVTNLANLRLMLPSANGASASAMPTSALKSIEDARTWNVRIANSFFGREMVYQSVTHNLLTPATINLLSQEAQGRSDNYFFAFSGPSSAMSPIGNVKLNVEHLRTYLNSGISSAQGAGSPKALLVEQLLTPNPPEASNWGGGDLSWLATSGIYTQAERRQIVANLIDYLDDDLIPTTDSVTAPTYFGVEMRADAQGAIRGHPIINFVSIGLIFNRSGAAASLGQLNSTRVLCSFGLTFPWASSNVSTADYTPEISIRIDGEVAGGVPALGTNASAYFKEQLNDQLTSRPTNRFAPFTGSNWPQAVGLSGGASYANLFGHSQGDWPERGPADMIFSNLVANITQLRLRYAPSGGGSPGYVQILPANLRIALITNPITAGIPAPPPNALQVKFTMSDYTNTMNLYLAGDPRAHFRSASWTNLASSTNFGTNIPPPASDDVVMSSGADTNTWDGAQGLPMTFTWYTNRSVSDHFSRASGAGMQSIGEIGYLWTGKPWQTVNLTRTNQQPTNDWNLLDYISSGYTVSGPGTAITNLTSLPLQLPKARSTNTSNITISNSLVVDGGFNVLTRKPATAAAFFQGASGLLPDVVTRFTSQERPNQAALGGVLANLSNLSSQTGTKFEREEIVRAVANAAVLQSRIFTVYSLGEVAQPRGTSQVLLEADVFVDVNPDTGAPQLRVLSKRFR